MTTVNILLFISFRLFTLIVLNGLPLLLTALTPLLRDKPKFSMST